MKKIRAEPKSLMKVMFTNPLVLNLRPAFFMKGNYMERVKVILTAIISAFMSWLGILAVPVLLLVGCNVIDYLTGLAAAKYRTETISSYKGIRGIIKKVCMWLLIIVGAMVDALIQYGAQYIGLGITIPFVVATIVAVWLIVNEIISILENMVDIGVDMPPFLLPLIKNIKSQVEEKTGSIADGMEENI